jgi:hypothetical protein
MFVFSFQRSGSFSAKPWPCPSPRNCAQSVERSSSAADADGAEEVVTGLVEETETGRSAGRLAPGAGRVATAGVDSLEGRVGNCSAGEALFRARSAAESGIGGTMAGAGRVASETGITGCPGATDGNELRAAVVSGGVSCECKFVFCVAVPTLSPGLALPHPINPSDNSRIAQRIDSVAAKA